MKYHDDLWNDLNNLLSHLRSFGVVNLVDDYYRKFGNEAPAELLKGDIEKLYKYLNVHHESTGGYPHCRCTQCWEYYNRMIDDELHKAFNTNLEKELESAYQKLLLGSEETLGGILTK